MNYMGGKYRLRHKIAAEIARRRVGRPYLEPFVGGGHVLECVPQEIGRWAGDACAPLITLYQAIQRGWEPPDRQVEKPEWQRYQSDPDPDDPMTALIGFGASFMGMWYSSYFDTYPRARRAVLRQRPLFSGTYFMNRSYDQWHPCNSMIYCDPPYAGTEGYMTGDFDHRRFWNIMQRWAAVPDNTVLVSEYTAPPGAAEVIAEWELKGRMKSGGRAVDRLFQVLPA